MGIPQHYFDQVNAQKYPQNDIDKWNRLRETYMFERARDRMDSCSNALVICGSLHMQQLAELFGEICNNIKTDDLRNRTWFDIQAFQFLDNSDPRENA
jgi:hypothetical protein